MAIPPDAGQPLPSTSSPLGELAQSARELEARGQLDVAPKLWAYRALDPVGHPGASRSCLDAAFLAAAFGLGGISLLRAKDLWALPQPPRSLPAVHELPRHERPGAILHVSHGPEGCADALSLQLGLAAEAAKLDARLDELHEPRVDDRALWPALFEAPLASLLEAFGSEQSLRDALAALLEGGVDRRVLRAAGHAPALDEVLFDVAISDGPLFVLAGATERLHDVSTPWVRRLEGPLARLAGDRDADALYDALPLLVSDDPRCHDERLQVEAKDGVTPCGAALVVRFDALDTAKADERARPLLRALKGRRTCAVLCDRRPETLRAVLARAGRRARVVVVIADGILPDVEAGFPDVLLDAQSGLPLDLDNALADADSERERAAACLSLPSLGLTPSVILQDKGAVAAGASALLAEAGLARARGELSRRARLAVAVLSAGASGQHTRVALRCLERMAALPLPKRPRPR
jgi:hypothetical protein